MSKIKWPIAAGALGTAAAASYGLFRYHRDNMSQAKKTTFGIICPMPEELAPFKDAMDIDEIKQFSGLTFYEGKLGEQHVVLVQCGIGKVNAAVCAEAMMAHFDVDYLINVGVAGATDPGINPGDLVIGTAAVNHDMDITCRGYAPGEIPDMGVTNFPSDEMLVNLAEQASAACDLEGSRVHKGLIASGDQFVAGGELAERITGTFQPAAIEMEGAAIAQTAWLNEVPVVIIRSISDNANADAPSIDFDAFLKTAVETAFELVMAMLHEYKNQS